jgi:hypothetical protein
MTMLASTSPAEINTHFRTRLNKFMANDMAKILIIQVNG